MLTADKEQINRQTMTSSGLVVLQRHWPRDRGAENSNIVSSNWFLFFSLSHCQISNPL